MLEAEETGKELAQPRNSQQSRQGGRQINKTPQSKIFIKKEL